VNHSQVTLLQSPFHRRKIDVHPVEPTALNDLCRYQCPEGE
jgi:hypothetical protein